jgi:hypothetical protein
MGHIVISFYNIITGCPFYFKGRAGRVLTKKNQFNFQYKLTNQTKNENYEENSTQPPAWQLAAN